MKKELLADNKDLRAKIKEKKDAIAVLQGKVQAIVQQGQLMNQQIAQNNTEILKLQGGIEALEQMVSK